MNNSFTHCPISNAVTSHPLVQQHSLDQVVVYKYPSYQWDHAVIVSVERREENKKREGGDIYKIVCHNLQHSSSSKLFLS